MDKKHLTYLLSEKGDENQMKQINFSKAELKYLYNVLLPRYNEEKDTGYKTKHLQPIFKQLEKNLTD